MKRKIVVALIGVAVSAGVQLSAHHSHASTYFEDQRMDIEGEVVQVSIRNPHSWVHVNVKAPDGQVQIYAIEWAAGTQLNRVGVDGKTLRAGDHVKIIGAPGRNPADHRLEMQTIIRPSDGWKWGFLPGEVVG